MGEPRELTVDELLRFDPHAGMTVTQEALARQRYKSIKNLEDALRDARQRIAELEAREERRRSFSYGNVNMSNPNVTRELIDYAADMLDRIAELEAENARLRQPRYCETFAAYGYHCEPAAEALREPTDSDWSPEDS